MRVFDYTVHRIIHFAVKLVISFINQLPNGTS